MTLSLSLSLSLSLLHVVKSHGWSLSLRSLFGREDAPEASDVSRIAKLYGGGGHRAAAGMRADVENIEDIFLETRPRFVKKKKDEE